MNNETYNIKELSDQELTDLIIRVKSLIYDNENALKANRDTLVALYQEQQERAVKKSEASEIAQKFINKVKKNK